MNPNGRPSTPLIDRFVNQIKLADEPVNTGPATGTYCWLWTGAINKGGYGHTSDRARTMGGGINVYAHRISYWLFVGDLTAGMDVDHMCRNSGCVNPNHLRELTKSQNSDGGWVRPNRAVTHCPRGHEYTEENTYVRHLKSGNKGRNCKECKRIVCRAQYYKRKAKLALQSPLPE